MNLVINSNFSSSSSNNIYENPNNNKHAFLNKNSGLEVGISLTNLFKIRQNKESIFNFYNRLPFKGRPVKGLSFTYRQLAGRNSTGHITFNHRGGGRPRRIRSVNFGSIYLSMGAKVRRIEYDPERTGWLALVCYSNGMLSYWLAAEGLKTGRLVSASPYTNLAIGNRVPLWSVPIGSFVYNLEFYPGFGGKLARAAGTSVQILKWYDHLVLVRLRSGELRMVNSQIWVSMGFVSYNYNRQDKLNKAGQTRLLGKRPVVRGVAMNPVDHPHGGDTSGGRPSVTPWGRLTKGQPTRSKRKKNKCIYRSVQFMKHKKVK